MLPIDDRRVFNLFVTVFSLSLLLGFQSSQAALGQTLTDTSDPVVEDLRRQISELQDEVGQLRERDVERQVWESSIIKRLPEPQFKFIGEDHNSTFNCDTASPLCDWSQSPSDECFRLPPCDGCTCCCGCYPCQCPLPQSPCICCPHVSTLSPHYNVHIFGAMVTDMLFNEARPVSPGTPFFLLPDSPIGFDEQTFDIHARSSYLAAALTGPQMGNLHAGGLASVLFYNDNILADRYGILPLQLWGDLKNENWRFAGGLQFDVFNPGLPTMLVFSALGGSGNAGNAWRGQIRAERFFHPYEDVQWTFQAALSEPISTVVDPSASISEDNGWPNIEGRIALGLGKINADGLEAKRPFEIGMSGLVGQIRTTVPLVTQVVADVWGLGLDARWKVNEFFGFMGEFYTGETLGTYNGAVLQTVNLTTLEGIRSTGGWGEIFFYWTPCLHSHVGYGIDDPRNSDVSVNLSDAQRTRNQTIFGNLIWDVNQSFRIGLELTWRETDYRNPLNLDNEGAGFHTQLRWSF